MNHKDALTAEEQENNRETITTEAAAAEITAAAEEVLVTGGKKIKGGLTLSFFILAIFLVIALSVYHRMYYKSHGITSMGFVCYNLKVILTN